MRKKPSTSVATQLALIISTLEQMVAESKTNAKERLTTQQQGRIDYVLKSLRGEQ